MTGATDANTCETKTDTRGVNNTAAGDTPAAAGVNETATNDTTRGSKRTSMGGVKTTATGGVKMPGITITRVTRHSNQK